MNIFLTGYRGSGKTTLGRKLALRLGRSFVDCDDLIVRQAGKSIREIFEQSGERAFRDLETEAVKHAAKLDNHVVALGGGALTRPENLAAIAAGNHKIIYLRCDESELLRRIQNDTATAQTRPNLTQLGGGLEEIRAMLAVREPIYRKAMSAEVDVTHLTPDEAAARVIRSGGF